MALTSIALVLEVKEGHTWRDWVWLGVAQSRGCGSAMDIVWRTSSSNWRALWVWISIQQVVSLMPWCVATFFAFPYTPGTYSAEAPSELSQHYTKSASDWPLRRKDYKLQVHSRSTHKRAGILHRSIKVFGLTRTKSVWRWSVALCLPSLLCLWQKATNVSKAHMLGS